MLTAVLDALPKLSDRFVALAMPKFQFSSNYGDDLKEALISIGRTAPFDIFIKYSASCFQMLLQCSR